MNLQSEKVNIIQYIAAIEDEELLLAVKNLLEFGMQRQPKTKNDFWASLPAEYKAKVELSLEQLDDGEAIDHESVVTEMRNRLR